MIIKGRVYISGKMSGMDEQQSKARFRVAENELAVHYGVPMDLIYNPWVLDYIMPGADYEEYMTVDMAVLETCSAVYMLNNWQDSPGAKREHERAKELGLDIWYEQERTEQCKR